MYIVELYVLLHLLAGVGPTCFAPLWWGRILQTQGEMKSLLTTSHHSPVRLHFEKDGQLND